MQFYYDEDELRGRYLRLFTRPGRGRALFASTVPPGRFESLPLEGSVELCAAALTDYSTGEGRLKFRGGSSRLVLPIDEGPAGRHEVMRLFLDVAPAR